MMQLTLVTVAESKTRAITSTHIG